MVFYYVITSHISMETCSLIHACTQTLAQVHVYRKRDGPVWDIAITLFDYGDFINHSALKVLTIRVHSGAS